MTDFNQLSATFMQWFTSIPGATMHPAVSFKDLRSQDAGRGLVATAEIPTETVLFTIPRKAILSAATSELAQKLPQLFAAAAGGNDDDADDTAMDMEDDEDAGPNPWSSLILVMLYEYLRGEASPWHKYFAVLPTEFDTPMFWSAAELGELQASALTGRIGKEEAEAMFAQKIVPALKEHKDVFYPAGVQVLSDEEVVQLAHRMGSTIMAYAFDLEGEADEEDENMEDGWVEDRDDQAMLGMVPMADMMNADAEFNAHVNHGEDALTVLSLRPIAVGEEILNYYGPHANSELLRKYGYVSERHSRYDVVEISFEMVYKQVQAQLSLTDQFMEKADNFLDHDEVEESIVVDRNSGDPGADGLFQGPPTLDNSLDELAHQVGLVLKALRKVSSSVVPDKRKRDEICAAVVRRIVQAKLAEYATPIDEDVALLAGGALTKRARMAVTVRAGEKKLLTEILASLQ